MKRSIAEFQSLWPQGSLLGIKLQDIDFRIWDESLSGLKAGLGFEMGRIYEVVCPGRDYTEPWIYILGERWLSVAIWGLVEVGVGFLGWGMRSEPDFSFGI